MSTGVPKCFMTLLERYILKISFTAFAACLVALTGVIWITQALRELDLLTGKGQTIFIFLTVTGLSLPALISVISPVALFLATLYTLNKLNGDSELIVMSAAGMPPQRLLRPFLALATFVCVIVGMITIYIMPASFQELRNLVTKIRADFVATMAKEGQFITLDNGITFHYRERSGDALLGIFMEDQREKDKAVVYLAERGQTVESERTRPIWCSRQGSVQRKEPDSRDSLHRRLRALCGRPLGLQPGGRRGRLQAARARHDPAPVPRQERASLPGAARGVSGPNCTTACRPGSIRWP